MVVPHTPCPVRRSKHAAPHALRAAPHAPCVPHEPHVLHAPHAFHVPHAPHALCAARAPRSTRCAQVAVVRVPHTLCSVGRTWRATCHAPHPVPRSQRTNSSTTTRRAIPLGKNQHNFLRELVPRLIRLGTNSSYFLSWFFHTGWAARTPRGAARAASRVRRMPRAVHGACAVLCTLHTCAVCCAPHAARRASLAPCHAPCATRWALCAAHRAQCVPHGKSLAAHSAARCTQHGTHLLLMLLYAMLCVVDLPSALSWAATSR